MSIDLYKRERWKRISLPNPQWAKYEISDFGRFKSYRYDVEYGEVLRGSFNGEYPSINIKLDASTKFNRLIHVLVAEYFCEKPSEDHKYVLHLDHDKTNNHYSNLKWATKAENFAHQKLSPRVQQYKERSRHYGMKLTEANVIRIKKMLLNKKTRMVMIAKQFGITPMQVNRIKRGENWGHIIV